MMNRHLLAAIFLAGQGTGALAQKLPPIPQGNHYTCYPAAFTDAFIKRAAVFTDQFGSWKVNILGISRVCMPARKTIDGKVFEPVDAKAHLTCYKIELASKNKLVDVVTNDQFGGHTNVRLMLPTEVCLPAGKIKMG